MLWRILRPRFWILDRKVRETNQMIIAAIIIVVAFGGQWLYNNLVRSALASLGTDQAVALIAQTLPMAIFLFILFALLGMGDVIYQLFLHPELELLMVAPVHYRTIFLVKLLQCSRSTLVPFLGLAAILGALGLAGGAAPAYYLLALLLLVSAMFLTTALIILLVILLARLLPARRVRSWIPAAVIPLSCLLLVGQHAATRWLLTRGGTISFLIEALLEPSKLLMLSAGMTGAAFLTGLAAYWAFNVSFHEGWNRFSEIPTRRSHTTPRLGRPTELIRCMLWLPSPLREFLMKEWLEFIRSPHGLVNLAQPLILAAVLLVPLLSSEEARSTLQPLWFWFMLTFLVLFLTTLPIGTTMLSVAREGKRIALLRSAPIAMSDVLKGKLWASWLPAAASWTIVLSVVGVLLRWHLWQIGFLAGITVWASACASAAAIAMAGLTVDFSADELRQRIPIAASYLQMALNLLFALLSIGICLWLVVRLFPEDQSVLVLQTLSQYGFARWLYSADAWIPLLLAGAQGAFLVGVVMLWRAAVGRLERWELAAR